MINVKEVGTEGWKGGGGEEGKEKKGRAKKKREEKIEEKNKRKNDFPAGGLAAPSLQHPGFGSCYVL
jgi:hypothetical protein